MVMQRSGGSWDRVLTEQNVPGTGVHSVQFHVVKETVSYAAAVVARAMPERRAEVEKCMFGRKLIEHFRCLGWRVEGVVRVLSRIDCSSYSS